MADQDFSVLLDDGKPNQISVGLVETPSHRMISYLLDPTKIGDALFCINEQDPDYLPLVGLRTRRLGEVYPYPAIQGYRAGNEVDVVCYMQAEGKELPPPARVIAYMRPEALNCGLYNDYTMAMYYVLNQSFGLNLKEFGVDEQVRAPFIGYNLHLSRNDRFGLRTDETGLSKYIDRFTNFLDVGGGDVDAGYYMDSDSGLRIRHQRSTDGLSMTMRYTITNLSGAIRSNVRIARTVKPNQEMGPAIQDSFSHYAHYFKRGAGSIPANQLIYQASKYNRPGMSWMMYSDASDMNDGAPIPVSTAYVPVYYLAPGETGGLQDTHDPDNIINNVFGFLLDPGVAQNVQPYEGWVNGAMGMAWEVGDMLVGQSVTIEHQFIIEANVACLPSLLAAQVQ